MMQLLIDGDDKTSLVVFGSINKKDSLNQQVDTLDFALIYHPGQTYRPEANSEVVLMDGATKVFGGKITTVTGEDDGNGSVRYRVQAKDYTYDLDRVLVNEEYDNETINDIVDAIVATLLAETGIAFTTVNVDCDLVITKISFARVTVTEVLQQLASISGFSWYVDYDKDIHFFAKNTEPAPFNIEDDDGNYILDSLTIKDDFSQIRNRVFIRGGEVEGEPRTELFAGDGERLQFKLSNKMAHLPVVEVGGSPVTVGVDFLDNETDFDAFWDFNQQYIRFKSGTVPPGDGVTNNIEVTGIPLYNLVVQVDDPDSIDQFGLFEFAKTDKTLLSREEVSNYAKAQLIAYSEGVIEGGFQTYESGLRSGQVIRVTSPRLGVDEDFLIQKVGFKMLTVEQGIWTIDLATLRTMGIIDFLISLLRKLGQLEGDEGEVVLEKTVFPREKFSLTEEIGVNTDDYPQDEEFSLTEVLYAQAINFATEFVLGPYIPDPSDTGDHKRVFILNGSRLG